MLQTFLIGVHVHHEAHVTLPLADTPSTELWQFFWDTLRDLVTLTFELVTLVSCYVMPLGWSIPVASERCIRLFHENRSRGLGVVGGGSKIALSHWQSPCTTVLAVILSWGCSMTTDTRPLTRQTHMVCSVCTVKHDGWPKKKRRPNSNIDDSRILTVLLLLLLLIIIIVTKARTFRKLYTAVVVL